MTVTVDGVVYKLKEWTEKNHVSYGRAYHRWKRFGWRDPWELIKVIQERKDRTTGNRSRQITQEDLDWLRETRPYRKGQPDEWEIACDLIGQPHSKANAIKKAVMAEERKKIPSD